MATTIRPAEAFSPGEFLREELEERGWTQADLAEIMGRPLVLVNEIIAGKRGITAETSPPTPTGRVLGGVGSERFRGIEHAGLVVVNMPDETDRVAAEPLVADVQRLRKDDALFRDILGWRGHRTPITAVGANIADPSDRGRHKALTRVRRTLRMPR